MGGKGKRLRQIPAEEFVRRLRMVAGQNDTHYAFWLGAGCSISSGIPGAGALVVDRWLPRLREIRGAVDRDLHEWAASEFPAYDPEKAAVIYGAVMETLFIQPEARQREVEELCDGRLPSFGYAVLAALLSRRDGLFNVALTTNFDDLIADAMYVFTEARPLVIHDELLAGFIRPTRMRPLVVKVHGDHRLSPRNTDKETEKLKEGISEGIGNLLHDRGVIFVGYGGNDVGIAELLSALPAKALPLGIWWASRTEPEGVMRDWLEQRDAIWVQIPGFDELMLLFKSEFQIPNPSSTKFDQIFDSYLRTYRELEKRVVEIPDSDPQASGLKDAAARSEASTTDWTGPYLQAARAEIEDPMRAKEILRRAIDEFPNVAQLPVALAVLCMERGQHAEALHWSQRALALEPEALFVKGSYAQALATSGHMEEALDFYRDMLKAEPENHQIRAHYGLYLARSGDSKAAKRVLKQLLEAEADEYSSMMGHIADEIGDHQGALRLHERGLEQSPRDPTRRAYYALCLLRLGRYDEASKEIRTALGVMPKGWLSARGVLLFCELLISSPPPKAALAEIKKSVGEGLTFGTWNFDPLIDVGREVDNPEIEWIERLADVLRDSKDPQVLDEWEKWRNAA